MSRVMPRTAADAPPLYQQVKDYIVTRILGGDWPEGNRVPSENELTRELSVSRMTVHRALRELTTEGWLERVQGAGTFVAPPESWLSMALPENRSEEHTSELQSLMRISYAVFCLKKKNIIKTD